MKNRTLPLSLIMGAALTIPSLAMAAPAEPAQVDMQETATTLETEAGTGNADTESVSNQSIPFQISETQTISRASVNSNANQRQAEQRQEQQAILLEQEATQDPQDSMQLQDLQEDEAVESL